MQHEKDTVDDVGDAINLLRSRAECFAELFAQVEKGVVVRGQVQAFGARLGVQALAQRPYTEQPWSIPLRSYTSCGSGLTGRDAHGGLVGH